MSIQSYILKCQLENPDLLKNGFIINIYDNLDALSNFGQSIYFDNYNVFNSPYSTFVGKHYKCLGLSVLSTGFPIFYVKG